MNPFILRQEAASVEHLQKVERYSSLPEVSGDIEELHLLGVYFDDYMPQHYLMRGMAADLKDGKPVSQRAAVKAFTDMYGLQMGLEEVLSTRFRHEFLEMIEEAR
ncbi:MAG: hypothetical protein KJ709_05195 [Nanoarchaeota archaeon]|nr:hypothetical protein [Nanoarchaeota archaeon]